jgi:hypothetical protein
MTPGHPSGFIEAFANLYVDIADALARYRRNESYLNEYVFGVEHAYHGLLLLQTAYASAMEEKWMPIVRR